MPVRVFVEDALDYDGQVREIQKKHQRHRDLKSPSEYIGSFSREDRLLPVMTIVIYWGREPWDGACDLKELTDLEQVPETLRGMVNSYPTHVLSVCEFVEIDRFRTDLREVFGLIQRADDKEKIMEFTSENGEKFRNLDEDAYDLIAVVTGMEKLIEKKMQYRNKERIDMRQGFIDLIEDGRIAGRREGRQEGLQEGAMSKAETVAHNAFLRGMSKEDVAELCEIDVELVEAWYEKWKGKKKQGFLKEMIDIFK